MIIELIAKKKILKLQNGTTSTFWSYEGNLLKGPASSLTNSLSYLGPTINVNKHDKVRIVFKNNLSEKSIVHWHGLDVDHRNDGHPHLAINNGESYQYDFVVSNRAGMYWYHPHPHGRTGFQVYQGLAGLFLVRDDEEKTLNLPSKEQELNLVIQDRAFKDSGELDYRPSMMGAYGNILLINGDTNKSIKVKRGSYRVRILNGCNARILKPILSNGKNITQIGSDGGLLEKPLSLDKFYLAPAERVDLIIDFSNEKVGSVIQLDSLPLVDGRGEKFTLINFEIENEQCASYSLPHTLCDYLKIDESEAINTANPKQFELIPKRGAGWTINGSGYEANNYKDYEIIQFGDTEIWEFYNPTGMPHPMHIHGTQFQILNRVSGQLSGCLDSGWKDTVLVMPGDRVQVIKRFNTFKGIFIYHCHNLEHEDMSMMRNFKVV